MNSGPRGDRCEHPLRRTIISTSWRPLAITVSGATSAKAQWGCVRGWDDRLKRPDAVKTIIKAKEGKEARSRLWRETRSLARVNHPNVCQVCDVLEEGESLVLIIGIARRPVHGGPPSHGHGYDLGSAGDRAA